MCVYTLRARITRAHNNNNYRTPPGRNTKTRVKQPTTPTYCYIFNISFSCVCTAKISLFIKLCVDRLHLGCCLFVCKRRSVFRLEETLFNVYAPITLYRLAGVRTPKNMCLLSGAARVCASAASFHSPQMIHAEKVQATEKQRYTLSQRVSELVWPRLWPSIEYLASTYGSTTTCVYALVSLSHTHTHFACLAIFCVRTAHSRYHTWAACSNCSKVFRQFMVYTSNLWLM